MTLGVTLIIALGLGWWVSRARQQAADVALIAKFRPCHVKYAGEADPEFPGDERPPPPGTARPWWPPAFLERWLGPDLFRDVVEVNLGHGFDPAAPGEDELIAATSRLLGLKVLRVDFEVTDAQVERLARLPALKDLDLLQRNPGLTDRGMRAIGAIRTLTELRVNHSAVTPAGLAALGDLDRLESLHTATMNFEPNAQGSTSAPPRRPTGASGSPPWPGWPT